MTAFYARRSVLTGLACATLVVAARPSVARALPKVVVTKDPTCSCCGGWVDHLRESGFMADVVESADMNRIKARLGIPQELASCHTAEVAGYVIEGYVPADAMKRLLAEGPDAKGLAVPGMPVGSPGMEVEGAAPETYDVVLFGDGKRTTFARYQGARAI